METIMGYMGLFWDYIGIMANRTEMATSDFGFSLLIEDFVGCTVSSQYSSLSY